mmetsp:Transcript_5172/g.17131  ORF Transcript_5172/g.17131 Transcript_5172/m.17131 type:complete len:212 (-) Transcript_5172:1387-2022(-)
MSSISSHWLKTRHLSPSGSAITCSVMAVTLVPHEPSTRVPAAEPSSACMSVAIARLPLLRQMEQTNVPPWAAVILSEQVRQMEWPQAAIIRSLPHSFKQTGHWGSAPPEPSAMERRKVSCLRAWSSLRHDAWNSALSVMRRACTSCRSTKAARSITGISSRASGSSMMETVRVATVSSSSCERRSKCAIHISRECLSSFCKQPRCFRPFSV